ncbi:P-loop containing nucleoside triphosphate hydrolase protein [Pilaira anomala]|nr:P-loop containing nucleoside triphosphate hydrolase protein [Pilaira anomala]
MSPPPPEQDKERQSNTGTMYHSHGIEVYHKPRSYETISDAGFNLQKLAWIEDKYSVQAFKRVRVVSEVTENIVIIEHEDDAREEQIEKQKVFMMNPPKFDHVEDMAELLYMHEPAVTYSGLFLVAVNPYRAGKTENTKIVIQYLASIAANGSNGFVGPDYSQKTKLEEQILQANPILESFGNAQTIRNNNSSRFGKFIRIAFNRNGDIRGAFIDWYLLETSRVHTQTLEERNYHIFYQLLNADPEMKAILKIDQKCPSDFTYTKNSNHTIQGVDDAAEYTKLVQSMNIMSISQQEQIEFFRIIVAVLYLGNTIVNNSYSRVEISGYENACEILGVSPVLFKKNLLEPQIRAGNEWVSQSKSPSQVKDNLDALSKVLYERNFGHLVSRVNSAIDGPHSMEGMSVSDGERFIGVLDIAGFEIFKINSFEQLCINYTNEKLQDFFNQNMFVLEEKEYKRENIFCDESFDYRNDLQPTINLIESIKNPIGILSCLEDECVTQGTDERLLAKITEQNLSNSRFKQDKYNEGFSVKHYAGEVKYSTAGWIERGKDPLNEHVARLFAESTNAHVATLFKDYAPSSTPVSATPMRQVDIRKSLYRTRKGGGNFHTVGYKHKQQLSVLMSTLRNTRPHFVRCILPNDRKRPGEIQPQLVLHQLRCNGVLEGIRICRVGFPNRLQFEQFREQYKLLAPELIQHEKDHRKACQILLHSVPGLQAHQFQIGRTKVFFKAGILGDLEEQRDIRLSEIATKIQAACLRLIARRKVTQRQSQDQLIRTIQRNSRIYIQMMQCRLWKVYHRRKELQYTFGTEDAERKKIDDLEQVLAASQEQLQELSVENQNQLKTLETQEEKMTKQQEELEKSKAFCDQLQQERDAWENKYKVLEQQLKETNEKLDQTQNELASTKQFSEEQAVMLAKIHQDIREESEENESLMIQCDELCKENNELQEKIQFLENDKTISDELQAELDAKDEENHKIWAEMQDLEVQHAERKKNEERESEHDMLQKEMIQYKGEIHEKTLAHTKIQSHFKTLESSLAKETEERKSYQKKNAQLERDVDMLTRLVQNEAKESRARAER